MASCNAIRAACSVYFAVILTACSSFPTNPSPVDGSMVGDAADVQMPTDHPMPTDTPNDRDVVTTDVQPLDVPPDRDPGVCIPSEADPLCATATRCECDLTDITLMSICTENPTMCMMASFCAPNRNHCGVNLPPDQMYEMFRYPDCINRFDRAVWSIGGMESSTSVRVSNGQKNLRFGYSTGASIRSGWTCSGDRCWENWSNMASDIHSWVRFPSSTNPCVGAFVETFGPGVDGRMAGVMPSTSVEMAFLRFNR